MKYFSQPNIFKRFKSIEVLTPWRIGHHSFWRET